MADETSSLDSLVAIRNKIITLIENDAGLTNIKKVYKGVPNSVPVYPCVLVDWTEDSPVQAHKGQNEIRFNNEMSLIVFEKHADHPERQDILLTITGKIKKLMVDNRYLDGLRATDGSWKTQDVVLTGTLYENLVKPNSFVLNSSEIKITIVTEGI